MKGLVVSHSIYGRVHALALASELVSDPGKNCVPPGDRLENWWLGPCRAWPSLLLGHFTGAFTIERLLLRPPLGFCRHGKPNRGCGDFGSNRSELTQHRRITRWK
jgi:hypothetical protein